MATSYVHPIARFQPERAKFKRKSAVSLRAAVGRAERAVTADRTSGVGIPTIAPAPELPVPTMALIREAVETALDSLDRLESQARDVARRFRRGALGEAQLGLTELVQSTQTLLRLADMTAAATGTDIDALCDAHGFSTPVDTNAAVSSLIREQLAQDWHALATVIDRPFLAALAGWRRVFETLHPGPHGTAA